jgi:predicted metal-dependent hydrolase
MSVRDTHSERSQSNNTELLRKAEERAENAERRVEKLENRLEAIENSRTQKAGENSRVAMTPLDQELESTKDAALSDLRNEPMMDHLLKALESGQDIGHYGRLVFAMIAHHFLPEEAIIGWLNRDPGTNPEDAVALLRQVESRDYNPPRRERILEWQSQQEFPILPNPDDPDCGNVYRNLKFPQKVYEHIQEYQEEKMQAEGHASEAADSR